MGDAEKLLEPVAGQNGAFFDEEREKLHRHILSAVAHDLKTPIASIIGSLEVYERMKAKLSVEKQQTLIRVALQEAYRLDNFITNMLDMAKLDNGMVKPKYERMDIGAMLRDCLMRLDRKLDAEQVQISSSTPVVEVTTDPVLLNRAVCLVLDNAVKFGGSPPMVSVEFGKDGNKGFISVRDNGPGVADDRKDTIFSKYTRFASDDMRNAGAGLGLAIGRETMRILGGDITVANHPEGGAVFTLHFAAD